jgi:spermidine/putrescine transport system substrate-binding protein
MMKRFFSVLIVAIISLSLFAPCVAASDKDYSHLDGTSINVYNWGEYISDGSDGTMDVNKAFEKRYGIKVNYTTYDSNENMYNKLKSGGANYDIVIPSDYTIAKLVDEDMLAELNFENIPNYKYILEKYKGLYYDPDNKYSVPYTVGMVGLIYNTTVVKEEVDSWSVLWDEKYKGKILMFNNPRDTFGIAQCLLGQSVNTTDLKEWDKAIELLKKQNSLVSSYVMDEIFNKMEQGDAALAPYYAGDFLTMHDVNPDLAFCYPKEGVNFFVDAMCIPKNAENKEAAELYINFMCEEAIAVENANYICYASPHKLVLESDDYDLKGNEILYPDPSETPKTQIFGNLDYDTQQYMSLLWNELKIEGNSNLDAYVGLSVTVVLVAIYLIYKIIKKKKREAYY